MAIKTFRFNATEQKIETDCKSPSEQCPAVQFYRAGIDIKVIVDTNDVFVKFSEPVTNDILDTMFSIGQGMCRCCRFNASKEKVR